MMISSNNPDIDVDRLMERVRTEVAAMRALSASHESARSMLGEGGALPPIVVDLSRHAVVTELVEDAARKSKPRTAVPRRLERAPLSALRPLVKFGLRVLNYTQKDQRHVNAATQQALREVLRLSVAIGNHVGQLTATAHAQRNATRDLASLVARVAASEQREAAFFERFGDIDQRISSRIDALESAMTVSAVRLDALETAMTVNAVRLDSLETQPLPGRVDALEHAMTLNAGRIDVLETRPVDARLLGLETAQTISSQRLERLESFRAESVAVVARLDETRRDLSSERERALRTEASLRSELTAQLTAANALIARAGPIDAGAGSGDFPLSAGLDAARYDDVHLAIADRFRGDSAAIAATLDRYVALVREAGTVDDAHPLTDVGSGRGEWLSTLANAGIPAFGLDTNAVLVARAREDGLDVRHGDALAFFRAMPPESLGAVSVFHVIEHLSFEQMIALFDESLRVLVPGGLLVCETPNPANVTIGACNFYLDPTHNRPLPSPLVSHLIALRGFDRVRVDELAANDAMRIDEDSETARRVNDFFYGPQNYAVVAYKPGGAR